jgi:hypothetical protein
MGLAWVPDDTGRAVVPASVSKVSAPAVPARAPAREWTGGPRHRRPTLLARSGQAVACRITALARTDPETAPSPSPHGTRQPAPAIRRYWA